LDASLRIVGYLCLWILGFRVVTEYTVKGTTFEKDDAPNAGAVLEAASYHIDDEGIE